MSEANVGVTRDGAVATLQMLRQSKLNAVDVQLLGMLDRAFDDLEADRSIRAVVLTGEGKAFCAGGDIHAWAGMEAPEFGYQWVRYGHRVFHRLASLRMPVVAALNGHALGGGLELAACADIRIAESQVRLGLPETSLGMIPGWSGTQRLVRRFGAQIVRRMVLGGETFTAEEGLRHGLVDAVVDVGMSAVRAQEYALRISARGPAAIAISKLMIAIAEGEDNGTAVETLGSILAAKTGDLGEGVAAFKEKRKPQFNGDW